MFIFSYKIISSNNIYRHITDKNKSIKWQTVFKWTFNRFTGGTDEIEFLLLKSARYKENFESPFISDFGGTPVLPEKKRNKSNFQISLDKT